MFSCRRIFKCVHEDVFRHSGRTLRMVLWSQSYEITTTQLALYLVVLNVLKEGKNVFVEKTRYTIYCVVKIYSVAWRVLRTKMIFSLL
jgi:hypothetical protein